MKEKGNISVSLSSRICVSSVNRKPHLIITSAGHSTCKIIYQYRTEILKITAVGIEWSYLSEKHTIFGLDYPCLQIYVPHSPSPTHPQPFIILFSVPSVRWHSFSPVLLYHLTVLEHLSLLVSGSANSAAPWPGRLLLGLHSHSVKQMPTVSTSSYALIRLIQWANPWNVSIIDWL